MASTQDLSVGLGCWEGKVASLHLHPDESGGPMREVSSITLIEAKGIEGNRRYFGRRSRSTGQPTVRQVSLMERDQILDHAVAFGLPGFPPGSVRANIETIGINLVSLIGKQVQIGDAILLICEARTPCQKMDALCPGLRARMEAKRQGVLAQVVRSGIVRLDDAVLLIQDSP